MSEVTQQVDSTASRKYFSNLVQRKVEEFLTCRRHANNILDILTYIKEDAHDLLPCILGLERIFTQLLIRQELYQDKEQIFKETGCSEQKYRLWMKNCYEESLQKLLLILDSKKTAYQEQALRTLMKFLALEGSYPQQHIKKEEYYFPKHRLQQILQTLLSTEKSSMHILNRFKEYTAYRDILYYAWQYLAHVASHEPNTNETFVKNILLLINQMVLPKIESKADQIAKVLCRKSGKLGGNSEFILNEDNLHHWMNQVWNKMVMWHHTPTTHKQLLLFLLDQFLPHMDEPLLLTDFFMDSLNIGGTASLLALQGVYILMKNHNLEYPHIFEKLYSLFEPGIFHTGYKARFLHLADMLLSSTHLPEYSAAAFGKRLASLTLIAPPQDQLVMSRFIGNLLLRYPGLQMMMMNNPSNGYVDGDPYLTEESKLEKCCASNSSLWELKTAQAHVLPCVSTTACFINYPLPSVEWSLTNSLEGTLYDIFEKETMRKSRKNTLAFDKPQSMIVPKHDIMSRYWKLKQY